MGTLLRFVDILVREAPAKALRIALQRAKGVRIGRDVYLGYSVSLDVACPELIEIQDHGRIGPGVIILAHTRPGDAWMDHIGGTKEPVRIERHAAIYAGAIIMPGVTVGECAIVREGAVVVESVPPYTMVAGSPARIIEQLPRDKAKL
jgi:acetyltransferase-like isoleucine patch superfamily enzyme